MTRGRQFERIENRISSGLADVLAADHDDPFPDVTTSASRNLALRDRSNGSSSPALRDSPAPLDPWAEPSRIASVPPRSRDHESMFFSGTSSGRPPSEFASPTALTAADPWTKGAVSAPQTSISNNRPAVSGQYEPTVPWLNSELPSRDGLTSSETLRDSDNDDWFYLEQIATYLDLHQNAPIDAHTGFNYVDGLAAARALGLAGLDDTQTMILMRAGLLVHRYAASAHPWRDALNAVELESQEKAQREAEQEQSSREYKLGRLLGCLAEATEFCEQTIARKCLWLWRIDAMHAREAQRKLLAFDQQTLLPPYLEGWVSQRLLIMQRWERAERLFERSSMERSLVTLIQAFATQRALSAAAEKRFAADSIKNSLGLWSSRRRERLQRALQARENEYLSLLRRYFNEWRVRRAAIATRKRSDTGLLIKTISKWRRLAERSRNETERSSLQDLKRLLNYWCHELHRVRSLSQLNVEAGAVVKSNLLRSLFCQIKHESRLTIVSRNQRTRVCAAYLRAWRAKTRLARYDRITAINTVSKTFGLWHAALQSVLDAECLSKSIRCASDRDLQIRLLHLLHRKSNEHIKELDAQLKSSSTLVAGRSGMSLMRSQVQRSEALEELSYRARLRSILDTVIAESRARKVARLDRMSAQLATHIQGQAAIAYFDFWRQLAERNSSIMAKLGQASDHSDCSYALEKWLQASEHIRDMESIADAYLRSSSTARAFLKWRASTDHQIASEVTAASRRTLSGGLAAKRILRNWRRRRAFNHAKVIEWNEDAGRQLAVIYFRTLQETYDRVRRGKQRSDEGGGSARIDFADVSPHQRTPSRRHAISPRVLELWNSREPSRTNNTRAKKSADEWGATPLSHRNTALSRQLSTPTKPLRLMRDLRLKEEHRDRP